jgi:hypothetical protein
MRRNGHGRFALTVLGALALTTAEATAWPSIPPPGDPGRDCPCSCYSGWHYWAPSLSRLYEHHYYGRLGACTPGYYPAVGPSGYQIITYPCPSAEPSAVPYAPGRPVPGGSHEDGRSSPMPYTEPAR